MSIKQANDRMEDIQGCLDELTRLMHAVRDGAEHGWQDLADEANLLSVNAEFLRDAAMDAAEED